MNNSFFNRFTPKDPKFFSLLKAIADILCTSSDLLIESLKSESKDDRMDYFHKIKEKEREGDNLSHEIFEKLSVAFITPFDREDIHLLANCLDDVIDRINSCAKRIAIYNPRQNNTNALQLGEIVKQDVLCISKAIDALDAVRKNVIHLRACSEELHDLENKADDLYEVAIINLFEQENNGIELVKVKEILSEIEKATDAAERVGKVLRTIIVKYA